MFKIGNIKIVNPVFLAPMVDVTDLAYRNLCRKWIGMAYTEMIYVDAILHDNEKTVKMLKTSNEDKPIGLQITGNNEKDFEEFIKKKEIWSKFDLIDLNCGCPSSRIVGNSAGSYLLNNPEKIGKIVEILKKTGKPITVKVRLGFKKNNILKVAKIVEKAGVSAISVHCRLGVEGNNVPADWSWLSKVKKVVKIPVIGNGDISSGKDVKEVLPICDWVMIARASIGNPLIFREIQRYLKTGKEKEISKDERIEEFRKYLKLVKKYDLIDIGRIKFLGGKFLKGFDGAGKMRKKLMGLRVFDEFERFIKI